jgi:hypothetical protein
VAKASKWRVGEEPPSRERIRPDIMILEGWPETSPPPEGPTKTYKCERNLYGTYDVKYRLIPRE